MGLFKKKKRINKNTPKKLFEKNKSVRGGMPIDRAALQTATSITGLSSEPKDKTAEEVGKQLTRMEVQAPNTGSIDPKRTSIAQERAIQTQLDSLDVANTQPSKIQEQLEKSPQTNTPVDPKPQSEPASDLATQVIGLSLTELGESVNPGSQSNSSTNSHTPTKIAQTNQPEHAPLEDPPANAEEASSPFAPKPANLEVSDQQNAQTKALDKEALLSQLKSLGQANAELETSETLTRLQEYFIENPEADYDDIEKALQQKTLFQNSIAEESLKTESEENLRDKFKESINILKQLNALKTPLTSSDIQELTKLCQTFQILEIQSLFPILGKNIQQAILNLSSQAGGSELERIQLQKTMEQFKEAFNTGNDSLPIRTKPSSDTSQEITLQSDQVAKSGLSSRSFFPNPFKLFFPQWRSKRTLRAYAQKNPDKINHTQNKNTGRNIFLGTSVGVLLAAGSYVAAGIFGGLATTLFAPAIIPIAAAVGAGSLILGSTAAYRFRDRSETFEFNTNGLSIEEKENILKDLSDNGKHELSKEMLNAIGLDSTSNPNATLAQAFAQGIGNQSPLLGACALQLSPPGFKSIFRNAFSHSGNITNLSISHDKEHTYIRFFSNGTLYKATLTQQPGTDQYNFENKEGDNFQDFLLQNFNINTADDAPGTQEISLNEITEFSKTLKDTKSSKPFWKSFGKSVGFTAITTSLYAGAAIGATALGFTAIATIPLIGIGAGILGTGLIAGYLRAKLAHKSFPQPITDFSTKMILSHQDEISTTILNSLVRQCSSTTPLTDDGVTVKMDTFNAKSVLNDLAKFSAVCSTTSDQEADTDGLTTDIKSMLNTALDQHQDTLHEKFEEAKLKSQDEAKQTLTRVGAKLGKKAIKGVLKLATSGISDIVLGVPEFISDTAEACGAIYSIIQELGPDIDIDLPDFPELPSDISPEFIEQLKESIETLKQRAPGIAIPQEVTDAINTLEENLKDMKALMDDSIAEINDEFATESADALQNFVEETTSSANQYEQYYETAMKFTLPFKALLGTYTGNVGEEHQLSVSSSDSISARSLYLNSSLSLDKAETCFQELKTTGIIDDQGRVLKNPSEEGSFPQDVLSLLESAYEFNSYQAFKSSGDVLTVKKTDAGYALGTRVTSQKSSWFRDKLTKFAGTSKHIGRKIAAKFLGITVTLGAAAFTTAGAIGGITTVLAAAPYIGIACGGFLLLGFTLSLFHRNTDQSALFLLKNRWLGGSGSGASGVIYLPPTPPITLAEKMDVLRKISLFPELTQSKFKTALGIDSKVDLSTLNREQLQSYAKQEEFDTNYRQFLSDHLHQASELEHLSKQKGMLPGSMPKFIQQLKTEKNKEDHSAMSGLKLFKSFLTKAPEDTAEIDMYSNPVQDSLTSVINRARTQHEQENQACRQGKPIKASQRNVAIRLYFQCPEEGRVDPITEDIGYLVAQSLLTDKDPRFCPKHSKKLQTCLKGFKQLKKEKPGGYVNLESFQKKFADQFEPDPSDEEWDALYHFFYQITTQKNSYMSDDQLDLLNQFKLLDHGVDLKSKRQAYVFETIQKQSNPSDIDSVPQLVAVIQTQLAAFSEGQTTALEKTKEQEQDQAAFSKEAFEKKYGAHLEHLQTLAKTLSTKTLNPKDMQEFFTLLRALEANPLIKDFTIDGLLIYMAEHTGSSFSELKQNMERLIQTTFITLTSTIDGPPNPKEKLKNAAILKLISQSAFLIDCQSTFSGCFQMPEGIDQIEGKLQTFFDQSTFRVASKLHPTHTAVTALSLETRLLPTLGLSKEHQGNYDTAHHLLQTFIEGPLSKSETLQRQADLKPIRKRGILNRHKDMTKLVDTAIAKVVNHHSESVTDFESYLNTQTTNLVKAIDSQSGDYWAAQGVDKTIDAAKKTFIQQKIIAAIKASDNFPLKSGLIGYRLNAAFDQYQTNMDTQLKRLETNKVDGMDLAEYSVVYQSHHNQLEGFQQAFQSELESIMSEMGDSFFKQIYGSSEPEPSPTTGERVAQVAKTGAFVVGSLAVGGAPIVAKFIIDLLDEKALQAKFNIADQQYLVHLQSIFKRVNTFELEFQGRLEAIFETVIGEMAANDPIHQSLQSLITDSKASLEQVRPDLEKIKVLTSLQQPSSEQTDSTEEALIEAFQALENARSTYDSFKSQKVEARDVFATYCAKIDPSISLEDVPTLQTIDALTQQIASTITDDAQRAMFVLISDAYKQYLSTSSELEKTFASQGFNMDTDRRNTISILINHLIGSSRFTRLSTENKSRLRDTQYEVTAALSHYQSHQTKEAQLDSLLQAQFCIHSMLRQFPDSLLNPTLNKVKDLLESEQQQAFKGDTDLLSQFSQDTDYSNGLFERSAHLTDVQFQQDLRTLLNSRPPNAETVGRVLRHIDQADPTQCQEYFTFFNPDSSIPRLEEQKGQIFNSLQSLLGERRVKLNLSTDLRYLEQGKVFFASLSSGDQSRAEAIASLEDLLYTSVYCPELVPPHAFQDRLSHAVIGDKKEKLVIDETSLKPEQRQQYWQLSQDPILAQLSRLSQGLPKGQEKLLFQIKDLLDQCESDPRKTDGNHKTYEDCKRKLLEKKPNLDFTMIDEKFEDYQAIASNFTTYDIELGLLFDQDVTIDGTSQPLKAFSYSSQRDPKTKLKDAFYNLFKHPEKSHLYAQEFKRRCHRYGIDLSMSFLINQKLEEASLHLFGQRELTLESLPKDPETRLQFALDKKFGHQYKVSSVTTGAVGQSVYINLTDTSGQVIAFPLPKLNGDGQPYADLDHNQWTSMISSDVSGPDQAFLTEFCKQFSPLEYSCLHEHLLKADFASHTKDTEQITSFFDTHCGPFPELANKVDLRAWLKKISPKDSDLKSSLYIFSKFLSTAAQSKPEDQSLIDFYQEVIDVTQPADGVMTTDCLLQFEKTAPFKSFGLQKLVIFDFKTNKYDWKPSFKSSFENLGDLYLDLNERIMYVSRHQSPEAMQEAIKQLSTELSESIHSKLALKDAFEVKDGCLCAKPKYAEMLAFTNPADFSSMKVQNGKILPIEGSDFYSLVTGLKGSIMDRTFNREMLSSEFSLEDIETCFTQAIRKSIPKEEAITQMELILNLHELSDQKPIFLRAACEKIYGFYDESKSAYILEKLYNYQAKKVDLGLETISKSSLSPKRKPSSTSAICGSKPVESSGSNTTPNPTRICEQFEQLQCSSELYGVYYGKVQYHIIASEMLKTLLSMIQNGDDLTELYAYFKIEQDPSPSRLLEIICEQINDNFKPCNNAPDKEFLLYLASLGEPKFSEALNLVTSISNQGVGKNPKRNKALIKLLSSDKSNSTARLFRCLPGLLKVEDTSNFLYSNLALKTQDKLRVL